MLNAYTGPGTFTGISLLPPTSNSQSLMFFRHYLWRYLTISLRTLTIRRLTVAVLRLLVIGKNQKSAILFYIYSYEMKKRYPLFLVLIFLLFDIDTRNFRKFATVNCKKKLQQEKKKDSKSFGNAMVSPIIMLKAFAFKRMNFLFLASQIMSPMLHWAVIHRQLGLPTSFSHLTGRLQN